jgi:hypothetical protein
MTLPNRSTTQTTRLVAKKQVPAATKKLNEVLQSVCDTSQVRLKSIDSRLGKQNASKMKQFCSKLKMTSQACNKGSNNGHRFERRKNLPKAARQIFHEWLRQNTHHPYPSDVEKRTLASQAGTSKCCFFLDMMCRFKKFNLFFTSLLFFYYYCNVHRRGTGWYMVCQCKSEDVAQVAWD